MEFRVPTRRLRTAGKCERRGFTNVLVNAPCRTRLGLTTDICWHVVGGVIVVVPDVCGGPPVLSLKGVYVSGVM